MSRLVQLISPLACAIRNGNVAALAAADTSSTLGAVPYAVLTGSAHKTAYSPASLRHGSTLPHILSHHRHSSHLAFEEVKAGAPTPEHPTAPPSRTLVVLHGLLGCGRNWRTWARRLVEGAAATHPPGGGPWRALLVDLRCHGNSTGRPGIHPPHNMRSAAEDVSRLIMEQLGSHAPGAVLGHSLGGKVALALLEQSAAAAAAPSAAPSTPTSQPSHQHIPPAGSHSPASPAASSVEGSSAAAALAAAQAAAHAAAARRAAPAAAGGSSGDGWRAPPRQLWVLDSQPGLVAAEADAGTGVSRVLRTVHSVPLPVPSRAWLLSHLREGGLPEHLTAWLASNLVPAAAGRGQAQQHLQQHGGAGAGAGAGTPLKWAFDPQGAGAMYMSYRTSEYWHVLERPPYGTAVHLVQGGRSDRWPADMQRRLMDAAAASASTSTTASSASASGSSSGSSTAAAGRGSFERHVLPEAGHWLHVDDPEGLLRLVLPRLAGL